LKKMEEKRRERGGKKVACSPTNLVTVTGRGKREVGTGKREEGRGRGEGRERGKVERKRERGEKEGKRERKREKEGGKREREREGNSRISLLLVIGCGGQESESSYPRERKEGRKREARE
jgi:hypothetical protein